MGADEWRQQQAAALKARADVVAMERERLDREARLHQARADAAWVRFADVDNEWQALWTAHHTLNALHDFHPELRKKAARSAGLLVETVAEDDGEAA